MVSRFSDCQAERPDFEPCLTSSATSRLRADGRLRVGSGVGGSVARRAGRTPLDASRSRRRISRCGVAWPPQATMPRSAAIQRACWAMVT